MKTFHSSREEIKTAIFEAGVKFFSLYGLKRTTIEMITTEVQVAKGSFYSFYSSKEYLCYEIIQIEETEVRKAFFNNIIEYSDEIQLVIQNYIMNIFRIFFDCPVRKTIIMNNEFDFLIKRISKNIIKNHIDEVDDFLLPLLTAWRSAGLIKNIADEDYRVLINSLLKMPSSLGLTNLDDSLRVIAKIYSDGLINR